MIRPFTAICMVLAAGSGLYLYQQKHKSQVLERQIEDTVKKTIAAQRRTLFLTAEWDLLNDPERLAKLSEQHLKLRTMNPAQFAAIEDLASRLPAVRATPVAPDHSTEEPGEADPVAEAPLPIPPALVPPPPMVARPAVTPTAATAPSTHAATLGATPAAPVATSPRAPAASSAPASSVTAAPSASAAAAPRAPVASPAPVASAAARPAQPAPRPQFAAQPAAPAATPVASASSAGMSALGMARGGAAPPAPIPVPISATRDFNPTGGN